MNLARISELTSLISRLKGVLKKLRSRRENLLKEALNAKGAQERLEAAAAAAKNRVSALSGLGLKAEFLEEIIRPVQNIPDCSGVETTVGNEISGIDEQINITNGEIWGADAEKERLEMEDKVCPQ